MDVSECMRLHIYAVLYYSNNSIMHDTITSLVCILLVGVLQYACKVLLPLLSIWHLENNIRRCVNCMHIQYIIYIMQAHSYYSIKAYELVGRDYREISPEGFEVLLFPSLYISGYVV